MATIQHERTGKLYILGSGISDPDHLTVKGFRALKEAHTLAGYREDIGLFHSFSEGKRLMLFSMEDEKEMIINQTLAEACSGRIVVLFSSCAGDSLAATLLHCLNEEHAAHIDLVILPGITSAIESASFLGAPLTDDFAVINLCKNRNNEKRILSRVKAASEGDFVIVLYHPGGEKDIELLKKILIVLLAFRSHSTPAAVISHGEGGEVRVVKFPLEELEAGLGNSAVFSSIVIGNGRSYFKDQWIITP